MPEPRVHSLPLAEVDRLWTQLSAVYGQRFIAQYDGMKLAVVKEDWRIRLAGMSGEQLRYALDNLPADRPPPSVLELRKLASAMPDERRMAALPPPRGRIQLPPAVRQEFERLREPPSEEPEAVRVARRYIELHDRSEATPREQELLAHYRRVLQRKGAAA